MKKTLILLILIFHSVYANECKGFVEAAWAGDIVKVKEYIDNGVNLECTYDGITPLVAASRYGRDMLQWDANYDVVKLLVENGADVNNCFFDSKTQKNFCPVYLAALHHHVNTAIYLVDHGGSLDDLENGYKEMIRQEQAGAKTVEALGSALAWIFGASKDNKVSDTYHDFKDAYMKAITDLYKAEGKLGLMYRHKKNYKKSIFWFRACERLKENNDVEYIIGSQYGNLKQFKKEFYWYQKSLQNGNNFASAHYLVGMYYYDGLYTQKDLKKAYKHLYIVTKIAHDKALRLESVKYLRKICEKNSQICKK